MEFGLMPFIGQILLMAFQLYSFAIIIYIFMSWVPNARESGFGQALGKIVEPYLEPFRKIIPPLGPLDLSPLVAIIALQFARYGIVAIFF